MKFQRAAYGLIAFILVVQLWAGRMGASAQTNESYVAVINTEVSLLDRELQESPINYSFEIGLETLAYVPWGYGRYIQTISFSCVICGSGRSLTLRNVTVDPDLVEWIQFSRLYTNSCLVLGGMLLASSAAPSGWDVSFDGRGYLYVPNPAARARLRAHQPPSVAGKYSFLRCSINRENMTLTMDLRLRVSSARRFTVDLSALGELDPMVSFDEIEEAHMGYPEPGRRLLVGRQDLSNLTLSGRYRPDLPNLDPLGVTYIPFKLCLDLRAGETVRIGSEVTALLVSSARDLVNGRLDFLNRTKAFAPDIVARFRQAASDLDDFELQAGDEGSQPNTFPLDRALRMVCQADGEMRELSASSSIIVAPFIFVVTFILAAIVSHLMLSGSKKVTFVLFAVLTLLIFEVHSGLRLFVFSLSPEDLARVPTAEAPQVSDFGNSVSSNPAATVILSVGLSLLLLLVAGLMIFRYSGTTSIESLSISNAVRLTRRRRMRGVLTIAAVATVAMATVPGITLRTIVPLISTGQPIAQERESLICVSNPWSLRLSSRALGAMQESKGVFFMSGGEAVFIAEELKMAEYTPVCVAFYSSSGQGPPKEELHGSILFANLTFLVNQLGLTLEKYASTIKGGNTAFMNQELLLGNMTMPGQLNVEGTRLDFVGTFDPSTLRMLDGESIESYLNVSKLFVGAPDWDSLWARPLDLPLPLWRTAAEPLQNLRTGIPTGRYSIPLPVIGVADIEALRGPVSDRVLLVIGKYQGSGIPDQAKQYLKSMISSNKIWPSATKDEGAGAANVQFLSSYSATLARGSEIEDIRIGFPVAMAFGTWSSQLILMSIGSLIILSTILNSVYERRGEAAIMSSLGASPRFINFSFLAEGLMLGVMGSFIGYFMGYALTYLIGPSSPEVAAELHSLTPLGLALLVSMVVVLVGSFFPARGAILKVVPSAEMLTREVGYIEIQSDGSRRVPIPVRLRDDQLGSFSSLVSDMAQKYSSSPSYVPMTIHSHSKEENGESMTLSYRGVAGLAETVVNYRVDIKYVPVGEFRQVELVVTIPNEKWSKSQLGLIKEMLYYLREKFLKIAVSKQSERD